MRRNTIPILIIVVLLIAAISYLNSLNKVLSPPRVPRREDILKEYNKKKNSASPSFASGLAEEELYSASPNPVKKYAVGYLVDEKLETKPDTALEMQSYADEWVKKHPDSSINFVCLDIPGDELTNPSDANVPLGLSLNGKQVPGFDINPGEGEFTFSKFEQLLDHSE